MGVWVYGCADVCPAVPETLKTGIAGHTPFPSDWKNVGSAESQTLKTGIAEHTPFPSDWKNVGLAESQTLISRWVGHTLKNIFAFGKAKCMYNLSHSDAPEPTISRTELNRVGPEHGLQTRMTYKIGY